MKNARAAHRITAFDTKPLEPVQEIVVESRILIEPTEVMEERANSWSKYWCPGGAPVHAREVWLHRVKRAEWAVVSSSGQLGGTT